VTSRPKIGEHLGEPLLQPYDCPHLFGRNTNGTTEADWEEIYNNEGSDLSASGKIRSNLPQEITVLS
jgi:hypothetical protein